ncbi:alpha/beta hydrolase [Alteribacter lacisalsi]|uniref:Alpha/beta hydrolase n=1 Tax=Alteribacter lacisalsi TaxID=2045244 RepID=A0A2W0HA38_9BACI|nr:alpha/beta hydrolase [Alteribacter lacisalsi]PYZ97646.1 alpha/beta hydrolase [Alteribacter lacisalsi]
MGIEEKHITVGAMEYFIRLSGTGSGKPLIVMEAGYGDHSGKWADLPQKLEETARVFTYDRAGLGKSGPPPAGPRTTREMVSELNQLLKKANLPPPYILVGHSYGGVNAQVFAAAYPKKVKGVVLLDSTPSDYRERFLPLMTEPFQYAYIKQFTLEGNHEEFMESLNQLKRTGFPRNILLTVVSAGKKDHYSPRAQSLWNIMQKETAAQSDCSTFIIAENSGHYIQSDEPDLAAEVVRQLAAQL